MSNAYPRRKWSGNAGGQRRSTITDADLARHGLGGARPATKPASPANPAKPAAPTKPAAPKIEGDPLAWVTLQRATDQRSGWTKTTRAMATPYGVVINTCSRNAKSASVAEAMCFVPSARIDQQPGKPARLVCLSTAPIATP